MILKHKHIKSPVTFFMPPTKIQLWDRYLVHTTPIKSSG